MVHSGASSRIIAAQGSDKDFATAYVARDNFPQMKGEAGRYHLFFDQPPLPNQSFFLSDK